MHEFTGDGRLRVNRNVPGMRLVQRLEAEWAARGIASGTSAWADALGDWSDEPVLDVSALDALPDGELDDGIRRSGGALGLRVAEPAERYEAALRSVAGGVAAAVAQLDDGGVLAGEDLWVCGGGTAVPPLLRWIGELTGRRVVVGPVDASAEGGLRGAAAVAR
jgi:rhamnulokinase